MFREKLSPGRPILTTAGCLVLLHLFSYCTCLKKTENQCWESLTQINNHELQVLRVKIFETNKRTTYKIELSGFGKVSASNWIESPTKKGTGLRYDIKPHFLFATLSVDEQLIKKSHILSTMIILTQHLKHIHKRYDIVYIASWWFQPLWKKYARQIGNHFPNFRDEKSKNLWVATT